MRVFLFLVQLIFILAPVSFIDTAFSPHRSFLSVILFRRAFSLICHERSGLKLIVSRETEICLHFDAFLRLIWQRTRIRLCLRTDVLHRRSMASSAAIHLNISASSSLRLSKVSYYSNLIAHRSLVIVCFTVFSSSVQPMLLPASVYWIFLEFFGSVVLF